MRLIIGFIAGKRLEATYLARRYAYMVVAVALVFVGGMFWIGALWVTLARTFSVEVASLVCGAIFIVSGLIVLWLSTRLKRPRPIGVAEQTGAIAAGAEAPASAAADEDVAVATGAKINHGTMPVARSVTEAFVAGLVSGMRGK